MTTLPSHYREEAEREIRAANLPKLLAVAERVRIALQAADLDRTRAGVAK